MWSKWGGSHARMLSVPPRLGVAEAAGVWAATGVGDVRRDGSAAAARPVAPAASRARREIGVGTALSMRAPPGRVASQDPGGPTLARARPGSQGCGLRMGPLYHNEARGPHRGNPE